MSPLERRAVSGLGVIFALRLMGLFIILPVFALYADRLQGHTPFLVGLTLGIYGLTQAFLQIPFGMLSDRLGRKPVIAAGLVIFAVGSVIAAQADTIHGVIIGRALQGAGAVGAVLIALAADLTRDEQRTKAMALIGVTVGASFIVSLILGPLLNTAIGVPGIFWMTAVLALGGIAVLALWVPAPARRTRHRDTDAVPGQFGKVLRDTRLLRLDFGIFVLHCVLTAIFVVVPFALVRHAGLPINQHWEVYLPVMLLSVVFMLPLIALAEKGRLLRLIFSGGVLLLAVSQGVLFKGHQTLTMTLLGLFLYFVAFNALEAMLPSLVSKMAPPQAKGTAIGVYSSCQFFGAFVGGAMGGWLYGEYGIPAVFQFNAAMLILWFIVAATMPRPAPLAVDMLHIGPQEEEKARSQKN